MKVYVIKRFGESDIFELLDMPLPNISKDEVLIKVCATSINPVDYKLRRGDMPNHAPPFPAILHMDVSGIVVDTGEDVTNIKKGDEVYGMAGGIKDRQGCLAEFVSAPAKLIHKKPNNLTFLQSAGVPLAALTAWEAMHEAVKINHNNKVLIYGGTGGVGHFAVQLAKLNKAIVCTTISNEYKAKLANELGADYCINYKTESVYDYIIKLTDGDGFDVVFDTVGGAVFDESIKSTQIRGHLVSIVARGVHDLLQAVSKGLHLHMINVTHSLAFKNWQNLHQYALKRITNLLESEKLKILTDSKYFKFSDIDKAHAYVESGKHIGKVCLEW